VLALPIAICGVLVALAKECDQTTTTVAAAARNASDLSLTLYRDGASSFLDVVTAQSTALEDERLAIAPHTRQLVADIGLMLARRGWDRTARAARETPACALSRGIARLRDGPCAPYACVTWADAMLAQAAAFILDDQYSSA
jgi:hypothetical protein